METNILEQTDRKVRDSLNRTMQYGNYLIK